MLASVARPEASMPTPEASGPTEASGEGLDPSEASAEASRDGCDASAEVSRRPPVLSVPQATSVSAQAPNARSTRRTWGEVRSPLERGPDLTPLWSYQFAR